MTATIETTSPAVDLDERRASWAERNRQEEPGVIAGLFEAAERSLDANLATSVDAIVDRVARRPDGSLDLERLARLTVAAAFRIDQHLSDHESNPWWEAIE
jgi:hypothetical protein